MVEQQETAGEAVTTRIGQTAILLHAGDREEARSRFGALWEELGPQGDPWHRCMAAHYLADAQDHPRDRLLWDLRALAAADGRDGGRGGRRPPAELHGFHPRLYLDLAADYLELGRPEAARVHLRRARALAEALGERERPALGVREAIGRLEARLAGQ